MYTYKFFFHEVLQKFDSYIFLLVQSTFDDMGINVEELSEYVEQFDCKALVTDPVPIFPQPFSNVFFNFQRWYETPQKIDKTQNM